MGVEGEVTCKSGFQEALLTAHRSCRPVLFRLNADTSFLLSLPYPLTGARPKARCRYNILIDPWLQGPQSDVASWFSTQWHVIDSAVKTIRELHEVLHDAEGACLGLGNSQSLTQVEQYIDAVVISHEFTDHCHEATLKELDSSTPVFATAKAVELINSWKCFDNVFNLPAFKQGFDWRSTSMEPLPAWIGMSRLITEGNSLYYHSAVVICIGSSNGDDAEAIIYTPHGVEAATFSTVSTAEPHIEVLAFLHGLHDVSLKWTKQLNLGAHNALKAQRLLRAKYLGRHS